MIDFTSRLGNIQNTHRAGGNWHKQLFIESTSFIASAAAGTMMINAGSYGLGFLITATPIGWVGLIIGGILVVGAVAGASLGANYTLQQTSGNWYDAIINTLGI
ncbi:hypothetical protein [Thalassomonas sp. RHCl1]|uniref:hypothetical protein n=1 Tax=Thalassomonas sp. RHCl1 TaxID=2995320 RepID=UPI00248B1E6E|nr:hypothetical protein [Thalassomonas sp. RHCl1]